jgi:hypothetical protein
LKKLKKEILQYLEENKAIQPFEIINLKNELDEAVGIRVVFDVPRR